jgi:ribosomal protein S18 acetylase RimI-like enzyme
MPGPDKLEQLKSCDGADFEAFYRIYAESISQREQKSKAWICGMVRKSDYKFLLLKRNNHIIGFSILFLPASESFGLLEYMAISAEHRNQGLGGELFQRSMQIVPARNGQPLPILLEVDSDREECADRKLRARRQQFYRRLGCLRLAGLHYILPLPGGGPPPKMDLMIYSPDKLQHITRSDLERWLRVIYHDVYNCSPDDPRIKRMLLPVSDPVPLQ